MNAIFDCASPGPRHSTGKPSALATRERHRQAPPSEEGHAQQPGVCGVLWKHPVLKGQGAQSCKSPRVKTKLGQGGFKQRNKAMYA